MATSEGYTVTTEDESFVESVTATLNGYQTCENYTLTTVGFEWGTNTEDPEHPWDEVGEVSSPGYFQLALTGLLPGTTYYFKAWVVWPDGSLGDEWFSFTTGGIAPINRVNAIKDITTLEAMRNLEMSAGGGRSYVDAEGNFVYESRFARNF